LERRVVEMCIVRSGRDRFDKAEDLIKGYVDCGYKVSYMYVIVDTYRLEKRNTR